MIRIPIWYYHDVHSISVWVWKLKRAHILITLNGLKIKTYNINLLIRYLVSKKKFGPQVGFSLKNKSLLIFALYETYKNPRGICIWKYYSFISKRHHYSSNKYFNINCFEISFKYKICSICPTFKLCIKLLICHCD